MMGENRVPEMGEIIGRVMCINNKGKGELIIGKTYNQLFEDGLAQQFGEICVEDDNGESGFYPEEYFKRV